MLVPLFAGCLLYWTNEKPIYGQMALILFILACLSDAVDGFLARRKGEVTRLGALMDPLADKMLLVTGVLSLAFIAQIPEAHRLPDWIGVVIVSRDLILLLGVALIYIMQQRFDPKTNFMGKATTVSQMALVLAALIGLPKQCLLTACYTAGILTVISGARYVQLGMRLLSNGDMK